MPRVARIIIPGIPHHVIQRGNRNQRVFFSGNDKKTYLKMLGSYCQKERVQIWCYCLMENHVHLIAMPEEGGNLRRAIGETHKKYTWMINARNNWKGHLWQGRFISYPMDEAYLYSCLKYIERNPVRAGMVNRPEDYLWSSARAHIFGFKDGILSPLPSYLKISNWRDYLYGIEKDEELIPIRECARSGRPLGSAEFLTRLESITGMRIRPRPRGRPRNQ